MRILAREAPLGVSTVNIVYTLAKQAMEMGAFKLARFAFSKLQVRGRGRGHGHGAAWSTPGHETACRWAPARWLRDVRGTRCCVATACC